MKKAIERRSGSDRRKAAIAHMTITTQSLEREKIKSRFSLTSF